MGLKGQDLEAGEAALEVWDKQKRFWVQSVSLRLCGFGFYSGRAPPGQKSIQRITLALLNRIFTLFNFHKWFTWLLGKFQKTHQRELHSLYHPEILFLQDQLWTEEREVEGCSAVQEEQGVGSVLWAGSPAAPAAHGERAPGQGVHHEADHQLPAHEEAAGCW